MSEAFTPGPWAVDEDDRPGMEWNRHIVVSSAPDTRICFMTSDGPEANAHLISAAPDLYTEGAQSSLTLREAANVFEGEGLQGMAHICRAQADKQDASLAKARGQS